MGNIGPRPVEQNILKNPVKWLDDRLPIVSFMQSNALKFPTPKNLNWAYVFGGIAMLALIVQILTGLFLAMHYKADVKLAFDSVQHIMRSVSGGWIIRNLHMVGASFFFMAVYAHMARGLYYGSYKSPREVLWGIGVIIFLIMMATAFMGYVLPWGQMSFWGATVITNLLSVIPFVGQDLVVWIWGGYAVGDPTLTRFYALHFLLPFVILGIVILHIWALHEHGNTNPTGKDLTKPTDYIPFHPYYTIKDFYAVILYLIPFTAMVFWAPEYLGHTDNNIPADPLVTPAHIVPEWYFLPFYAILRAIPIKELGVLAMFGSILILFILPWLDTNPTRSARNRPIYRQLYWVFLINFVVLGWVGSKPPEGMYVLIARVATAAYFAFFLLLPFIGRAELKMMKKGQ
jgi:ubiquinol-cytochrome c reductase cytochrome b/c1 subunit